ncbi:MAG TPA: YaiO family outer membrane beta-barrel protein [Gemmatimonadaceae bacterium]
MIINRRLLLAGLGALAAVAAPRVARTQETAVQGGVKPGVFIAAEASLQSFQGDMDPWRLGTVAFWRRSRAGTFIAKVNYANRYATDGVQAEVEAYPRVSDKLYLYLDAGYSSASVFPAWRSGAELFSSLPDAWEASIGYRQLRFNGIPVTMFTGALGKYVGNYWLSLRPYIRSRDGTTSATTSLMARRYFADGDHWVGGTATYGNSPTERVTPDAVALNKTFSVAITGSTGLTSNLLATWLVGHDAEQLGPGNTRRSVTVTAGLRRKF